jgi:hypothetical protein
MNRLERKTTRTPSLKWEFTPLDHLRYSFISLAKLFSSDLSSAHLYRQASTAHGLYTSSNLPRLISSNYLLNLV